MRYLLDTCVISEVTRPQPCRPVVEWLRGQDEGHLFLSVLTLGELRKGIERLPESRKRVRLENWLDRDLSSGSPGGGCRSTRKSRSVGGW